MKKLLIISIIISLFLGGLSMARTEIQKFSAPESINEFTFDLYEKLKDQPGNLFCSPYSISTALAMTYAGAQGETARQMEKVLHLSSKKEIHSGFSSLINQLNNPPRKDSYKLLVANALWGQKGYRFNNSFLKILKNQYHSELNQLNFNKKPEASRRTINKWVEKKTNKKIKDLLKEGTITPLTRLILTNAIYFKAAWAEQFEKALTKDAPFYLTPVKKVTVPMMKQKETFGYFENKNIQLLELPYVHNDLSMLIILPKNLGYLEKNLTAKTFKNWTANLRGEEVIVYLPKFKITSTFGLSDVLSSMGMKDAFSLPPADFSGMTGDKDFFISGVLHKAYVNVNEEGTEAAAATAVLLEATALPSSPPKIFRADHPFIFLIRDNKSGCILFIGRVVNPKK